MRPFDPTDHDLKSDFRLTSFAALKGWGCKLPQEVLLKLLEGIKEETGGQDQFTQMAIPKIGMKTSGDFIYIIPNQNLFQSIAYNP